MESITEPNMIGAGIYAISLKMTNCTPRANDLSSSSTDLQVYFISKNYKQEDIIKSEKISINC